MGDADLGEVFRLEERRWAAMITKDAATLSELFADEMSATHANSLTYTKASYLNAIERTFDYQKVECSDSDARRVGDTVLLTGRARMDVAVRGRQAHVNARYSVVWVRQDDRWQFLCWQATTIPA